MYTPDATDMKILRLLQQNARLTHKELADKLHLTTTPVYERIRRLEREGYILKQVALLNKDKVGKSLVAYCNVSLKEHARPFLRKFEKEVLSLTEVVECYHIAGNYDYLLKVMVKDMAEYQNFIVHKLATLDNIGQAQSSFVMTEVKYSTALPI